jgi:glucokinase
MTMIIAGDIGGTKTNLALYSAGTERPHAEVSRRFETAAYPDPEALIEDFLRDRSEAVTAACLAVAGPVADGRSRLTNLPWTLVADDLAHHFGWRRCRLLNDVEATVHALPLLAPLERATLQAGATPAVGNCGILAPGTGLGVAWSLPWEGGIIPVATEAGHSDFAPVDEESLSLWRFVARKEGRASLEHILSGPGLARIYRWRRHEGDTHPDPATGEWIATGEDPAARISQLALQGSDPVCLKALECFVRYLGAAAGNLALTAMTRGGIYLAGGIPPKILPKLGDRAFLDAFCDKGPFSDLMATIPVHVVLMESAPILGAAHVAMEDSP